MPIVERSMATLTQRLSKEEAMNKQWGIIETMDNAFFSPPTHNTNHGATSQERGSTSQERGRGSRGRRGAGHKRPRVVCHYCGITFHTANVCRKRIKDEAIAAAKQKANTEAKKAVTFVDQKEEEEEDQDHGYMSSQCFTAREP